MRKLTVRLTEVDAQALSLACRLSGKTRSQCVQGLLSDSLRAYRLRQALQSAHAELGPLARQRGWLTEDDVLHQVS